MNVSYSRFKAMMKFAKLQYLLARDVGFTPVLYIANVDFVCCDNPNANKLTIQLLSVLLSMWIILVAMVNK
jgi:hypothetical protein